MKHIPQVKKVRSSYEIKAKKQPQPNEIKMFVKYFCFTLLTELPFLILLVSLKRRYGFENEWFNYTLQIPQIFLQTLLYKRFVFLSDEKYLTAVFKILLFCIGLNLLGLLYGKIIPLIGLTDFEMQLAGLVKTSAFFAGEYIFIRKAVFGRSIYSIYKND
ncbi:MAG: hypothetical protein IJU45_02580 [Clostridia bacterium]|nr:hypothetical protein [Clostridia bacterium]